MAKKTTKRELEDRITLLEGLLERQVVRSMLYLELIATTREIMANFSQAAVMSTAWDGVRKLLSDDKVFKAEVDKRLKEGRDKGWDFLKGVVER